MMKSQFLKLAILLSFAASVFLLPHAHAAITLVQTSTNIAYSSKTVSKTLSSNATINDYLLGVVDGGQNPTAITSNCATFTTLATTSYNSYIYRPFYGIVTSSGSCTVSSTMATSSTIEINLHEVRGLSASSPLDVSTTTIISAHVTNPSTTITTTQNGDYIFGFVKDNGQGTSTVAGSGFTWRINQGQFFPVTEDMVQSSAGSQNVGMTWSTATNTVFVVVAMSFKAPASTASPTTSQNVMAKSCYIYNNTVFY